MTRALVRRYRQRENGENTDKFDISERNGIIILKSGISNCSSKGVDSMQRPNLRFVVLVGLIFSVLAHAADGAVRIRTTRSKLSNPFGQKVFSSKAARAWGGVILQAQATFVDNEGEPIDPAKLQIKEFDTKHDQLVLSYQKMQFTYTIDEHTFDRIFSWVENEGTGLFSAYPMTKEARTLAGVTKLPLGGNIANEFADSKRLRGLAQALDFESTRLSVVPKNLDDILKTHNDGITLARKPENLDYVVSDLDSQFVAQLSKGTVKVRGTLYVYFRVTSSDDERVFVRYARKYYSPEDIKELLGEGKNLPNHVRHHVDAVELARLTAMLRTLYRSNRAEWNRFADDYFEEELDVESK